MHVLICIIFLMHLNSTTKKKDAMYCFVIILSKALMSCGMEKFIHIRSICFSNSFKTIKKNLYKMTIS